MAPRRHRLADPDRSRGAACPLDKPRPTLDDVPVTLLADLLIALRFFSRLPVPTTRRELDLGAAGLAAAVAAVPLAGAVIGLVPAAVLLAARALRVPSPVAAALAIAALLAVTGALHEDGLADCADGFGGGRTRERKLAIMRDSAVGTYGACAVALSILLRVAALAAITEGGAARGAAALVATAALSRGLALLPLVLLSPARVDGNGAAVRPRIGGVVAALALAGVIALALPSLAGMDASLALVAAIAAGAAAVATVALAHRQIGGQTGDVAGATQQAAEIVALVVFSAG